MSAGPGPILAVVYDLGSASPRDIALACRDVCGLVFVCPDQDDWSEQTMEVLASLAPVVRGDADDPATIAASLRRHGVTGIVTFADRTMPLTSQLATALGLDHHAPDVVRRLTDKYPQRARLAEAGVATPRYARIDSAADLPAALDAIGYPAVLKPRAGGLSRNTHLVSDRDECVAAVHDALRTESSLILEEMLVGDPAVAGDGWGDHVSVETVLFEDEVVFAAVTGKFPLAPPFRETGNVYPSTLDDAVAEAVRAEAVWAVRALGVRSGVCHTEVKLTADGPRVIEVNGRMGGFVGEHIAATTGYSLLDAVVAIAIGRRPAPAPTKPANQVAYMVSLFPPMESRTITALAGLPEARRLPGVDRIVLGKTAGAAVDWRAGSLEYLVRVHGTTTDHAALRELVDTLATTITCTYET